MSLTSLEIAKACREYALDKKAVDPVILDLREVSTLADYFVICSGLSDPQLKAIANGVTLGFKDDHDLRPSAVDGSAVSQWMIIDYGDVLMHIFHENKRSLYSLEQLWGDAKVVE
ncbi:MAG: ribosome silencing factor [Candidatus Methylacidiphilales bacterium]|nr:ribosome silencing factor [Candidatus Methylacidiphilales bacterium]